MTIYGATYHDTYDDEDRLTSVALPGGPTDTFTYNGLGLRVGKNDSTGNYVYTCDGTSPGSPVLSDIYNVYTPGESEHRGSTSSFYANDRLGNLWTLDMAGGMQSYYQDTSGFGALTAWAGGTSSQFKFGGGNGCQSDADTGLVLMGHRYYDARIGRFLTADPAGDGDNWYAYADNDPVDEIDPEGLWVPTTAGYGNPIAQFAGAVSYASQSFGSYLTCYTDTRTFGHEGSAAWVQTSDTGWVAQWSMPLFSNDSGIGGNAMFASSAVTPAGAEAAEMLAEETGGVSPLGKFGPNPLKEAARQSLRSLKLTEEQVASGQRAISRATASSKIAIKKEMENLVINITRPGRIGYQNFEHTINPAGDKTVIQKAFDELGNLVHYDPKLSNRQFFRCKQPIHSGAVVHRPNGSARTASRSGSSSVAASRAGPPDAASRAC